jgi:NAD(P)-dependent dehydrogenase (short-subunit alcohol dehydrogenase family)
MTAAPITADATVQQWLDHPTGGPLLTGLLAAAGRDAASLAPARSFPLGQLVQLSGGLLSQDALTDLVREANGGVVPDAVGTDTARWAERIVAGRFDGRTVIVTGAASGIGRATASRVAREGGRVVAVDLTEGGLATLVEDLAGLAVEAVPADITDPEHVARIVEVAGAQIDGLANVAGVTDDMTPLHEVSDAMWRRNFAVNVDGTFLLSRAVLPAMLAAGRGSIVNVASEAALRGSAAGVAYTAAKHAVVGITKSSAFMYGPSGIRVNAVAPGPTLTAMRPTVGSELGQQRIGAAKALLPEIADPSQLAASITFLLSDDATNLSGAILPSDGGWSAA